MTSRRHKKKDQRQALGSHDSSRPPTVSKIRSSAKLYNESGRGEENSAPKDLLDKVPKKKAMKEVAAKTKANDMARKATEEVTPMSEQAANLRAGPSRAGKKRTSSEREGKRVMSATKKAKNVPLVGANDMTAHLQNKEVEREPTPRKQAVAEETIREHEDAAHKEEEEEEEEAVDSPTAEELRWKERGLELDGLQKERETLLQALEPQLGRQTPEEWTRLLRGLLPHTCLRVLLLLRPQQCVQVEQQLEQRMRLELVEFLTKEDRKQLQNHLKQGHKEVSKGTSEAEA